MNETQNTPSPFKFLDAYDKEDREVFFGRDLEIEELYESIFESNLIVLYGAVGTGKTSLIRCGLANQFDDRDWLPLYIRRGNDFLESIKSALSNAASTAFKEDADLSKCIRSLYLDHYKTIYLILDQFEEIFILGAETEQIRLFENLQQILEAELPCKVLISIRGDYFDRLSKYEYLIPELIENRLYLERMSRQQLSQVIEHTTQRFSIELINKEAIIQQIIEGVSSTSGSVELPHLQIYLDQLYRSDLKRRGQLDRPVIFDRELVAGTQKLEDVLEGFLKEQLYKVNKELEEWEAVPKNLALEVLLNLVTEQGTKKSMDHHQLIGQVNKRRAVDAEAIAYCIQRFLDLRIIRTVNP